MGVGDLPFDVRLKYLSILEMELEIWVREPGNCADNTDIRLCLDHDNRKRHEKNVSLQK